MAKKYQSFIFAALFIGTVLLSGCQALQQFALDSLTQGNQDEEGYEELPTLPNEQGNMEAALIPLDVIVGNVEYTPPQISGDGSMILYRHITQFEDNVIAQNWKTGEETKVLWPYGATGNPYFSWAPDGETEIGRAHV